MAKKKEQYTPHLLEKNKKDSSVWEFEINGTVFWILIKGQTRNKKTIQKYFSEKFATFELEQEKYMYWLSITWRNLVIWTKEDIENVLNKV